MAARIPFGYEIIGGKAYVNKTEAEQLRMFFRRYLAGMSMNAAAREAGLPLSPSTYPHLFKRKEYTGTDYYPPIITAKYQKELTDEWERRKRERPRQYKPHSPKGVRIFTDFKLVHVKDPESEDPVDYVEGFYRNIHPKIYGIE